jgi:hypothetical protein
METLPAEDTRSVRPEKRRDHLIADLEGLDVGADGLDDPDELVAHRPARVFVRHGLVRPQVAAADRGARDADERVRRVDQPRIRDVLDPDIASSIHQCCPHTQNLPVAPGERPIERFHRQPYPCRACSVQTQRLR